MNPYMVLKNTRLADLQPLRDHLKLTEKVFLEKFGRNMTPRENDEAIRLFEQGQTTKRATGAQEKNMISLMLKDTSRAELQKALVAKQRNKGLKVYLPSNVEADMDSVEAFLLSVAGDGTEQEAMYPTPGAARFPRDASIVDRPANEDAPQPQQEYRFVEPSGMTRVGPNFIMAPVDPNIAPPAPFDPSEPEDREQGPAPVDFTTDVSPIFKSHGAGKVSRRGIFSNLVDQSSTGA